MGGLDPIVSKTKNLDKALQSARVDASNIEAIKQLKGQYNNYFLKRLI